MKRFCTILAIIALCASVSAQTVKPLAYNMTNGIVMVSTNVTWSNSFKFSTNIVAAQVRTNLGLGTQSSVKFAAVAIDASGPVFTVEDSGLLYFYASDSGVEVNVPLEIQATLGIGFATNGAAAATRTNLGLPLAALTNTSNVTMMRALSGSTNTNTPYSGSVSLTNTNTLVFSNGILQSVQ